MKRFKGTATAAQATTKLVPGATQAPLPEATPQIRQSMGAGITPTAPLPTSANANPRGSVPSQTPTSMSSGSGTSLASGMTPLNQPGSTRNADTKKSEKVKDFYSSLLNKKKDKNRASTTTVGN